VYVSAWSVIYSAGISLWPRFARTHAAGEDLKLPWRQAMLGFLAAGAVVGGSLAVVLPIVVHVLSDGTVRAPALLVAGFAGLIVVQATHLPSAMLLTRPALLRFQAGCVLAMVAINIPLSWILAGAAGAAGPVIGSAVAIALAQLIPGLLMARHVVNIRPGRGDAIPDPAVSALIG